MVVSTVNSSSTLNGVYLTPLGGANMFLGDPEVITDQRGVFAPRMNSGVESCCDPV